MNRISLLFWLILASMLFGTTNEVAAQTQKYQTYRQADAWWSHFYTTRWVAAKILLPLGIVTTPPLELDRVITPEDATLVLYADSTYHNYHIPPGTVAYVQGGSQSNRVKLTGESVIGAGAIIMLAPNTGIGTDWQNDGDRLTIGTPNGELTQIIGQGGGSYGGGIIICPGDFAIVNETAATGNSSGFYAEGAIIEADGLYLTQNTNGFMNYLAQGVIQLDHLASWDNTLVDTYIEGATKVLISNSTLGKTAVFPEGVDAQGSVPSSVPKMYGRPPQDFEFEITFENTVYPPDFLDNIRQIYTNFADEFKSGNQILVRENRFGNPIQVWPPVERDLNEADFNCDGVVDFDDFFAFVDNFGKEAKSFTEGQYLDLDSNGTIDFGDFFIFVDNFGDRRELAKLMALAEAKLGLPKQVKLLGNYPNPFNPNTTINFFLPQRMMVDVSIYNLAGQKVATLAADTMETGTQLLTWDATDGKGRQVASGMYLCVLNAGGVMLTKKLTLLR